MLASAFMAHLMHGCWSAWLLFAAPAAWAVDLDGDGYEPPADCDDADPGVHPGVPEIWYDGTDADCGGASDFDRDGDGVDSATYGGADCDDARADVHPGADEIWYDGVDQNCDGWDDFDADADGFVSAAHGGTDCDDADPSRNPGAADVPDDGNDQNCTGADRTVSWGSGACAMGGGGPPGALAWVLALAGGLGRRRR